MKRGVIFIVLAVFIAAIPLSHALKATPAAKVTICHVNQANDTVPVKFRIFVWSFEFTVVFGRVIDVSEKAVPAHLAHGDSLDYAYVGESWLWPYIEHVLEDFGYKLVNENCFFIE
jgi:hypothetical protein